MQCIAVGVIWGATNAGLKYVERPPTDAKLVSELTSALTNWRWLAVYGLNQLGSLLYFYTLASSELSFAVPLTQATTLLSTIAAASVLGERVSARAIAGCGFVLVGMLIMVS